MHKNRANDWRTGSAGDALTHRSENHDLVIWDLFIRQDPRLVERGDVSGLRSDLDQDGE